MPLLAYYELKIKSRVARKIRRKENRKSHKGRQRDSPFVSFVSVSLTKKPTCIFASSVNYFYHKKFLYKEARHPVLLIQLLHFLFLFERVLFVLEKKTLAKREYEDFYDCSFLQKKTIQHKACLCTAEPLFNPKSGFSRK